MNGPPTISLWFYGKVCVVTDNPLSSQERAFLPPATKLGQGYVFTGVCDSVNGGGCLPQRMLGYPPGSRHPPTADTPPGADTPTPAQSMLGDTVNARAVHILLECNLVYNKSTTRHGTYLYTISYIGRLSLNLIGLLFHFCLHFSFFPLFPF